MDDPTLRSLAESDDTGELMPALFIGHGSPSNAIEETEFSQAWAAAARALPRPRAIVCVSAHWETQGTLVTTAVRPRTIHDFYGFPPALHAVEYPAPGSPETARLVQATVTQTRVEADLDWGLDHGAWAVLRRMFPAAETPVIQLSLDQRREPAFHYALGRELGALRRKGVLIVGSGNVVHNLREVVWEDVAYEWAQSFDDRVRKLIEQGDHRGLVDYAAGGAAARLAIPTPEHYLPLLYVMGARGERDPVSFFAEKVTLGSMSMRCVRVG